MTWNDSKLYQAVCARLAVKAIENEEEADVYQKPNGPVLQLYSTNIRTTMSAV